MPNSDVMRHPLLQVTFNGKPAGSRPSRFTLVTDEGFPNVMARISYPAEAGPAAVEDKVAVSLADNGEERLYFTGNVFDSKLHGACRDIGLADGFVKLCRASVTPAYRKETAPVILRDALDAAGIADTKITCPPEELARFSTASIPALECIYLLIDALKGYGHTGLRFFFDKENVFRFGTVKDTAVNEGENYVLETGENILRTGSGWVEILPLPIRHSQKITVDGEPLFTYRTALTVSRDRSRMKLWVRKEA
jgi:hypothetical protein